MAKTKTSPKPRCFECKKLTKGTVHTVPSNGKFSILTCDKCYKATQQCDVCFNLTGYNDGAIRNFAPDAGENGDSVICRDCSMAETDVLIATTTSPLEVDEEDAEAEDFDDTTDQWGNPSQLTVEDVTAGKVPQLSEAGKARVAQRMAADAAMPYTCCECKQPMQGEPIMQDGRGVCGSCARPATCDFMTIRGGICGHPLVDGKCRFINHVQGQAVHRG